LVAPEHTSGNLDTEACAVDKIVDTAITNDPPDSTPFNSGTQTVQQQALGINKIPQISVN
jgi:hypothetical protein